MVDGVKLEIIDLVYCKFCEGWQFSSKYVANYYYLYIVPK